VTQDELMEGLSKIQWAAVAVLENAQECKDGQNEIVEKIDLDNLREAVESILTPLQVEII
jgi:hypothetical protein